MFAVLALFVLVQQGSDYSQATLSGVVVTDFRTPQGLVRVYLPDDLAAGDTISGTVYTEPSGGTEEEKRANAKLLQGVVVYIDSDLAVTTGSRLVVRSMDKSHRLQRTLRMRLAAVGQDYVAPLSVPDARADRSVKFTIPELSAAGRPVLITGPFDGDTTNTRVDFGGKDATVLAETPRSCVVQTDPSFVGPRTLVLNEAGQTATRTVVLPKLTLS